HHQEARDRPGAVRDAPAGDRPRRARGLRVGRGRGDDVPGVPAADGPPGEAGMVETRVRRPGRAAGQPGKAPAAVLIVDDEELIRDNLAEYLTGEGFAVVACCSGEEALERAARQPFAVALCDVHLPGIDGLELLDRLQQLSPQTSVLLITASARVESAVEAFQHGAHDYLMKPILLDEVLGKVRRLLAQRALALENQWLRRELNRACPPARIVGHSPAMARVWEVI